MLEAQLNVFDSIVIGVFALSCLVAFFRGFIREILSLGAWVAAGIITVYFYPHSSEYMKQYIENPEIAAVVGALGTYITALFGISIINSVIIRYVKTGAEVGLLDNLLGLSFGAARGAFIVSLGFLILTFVMDEDNYPEWLTEAKTLEYAEFGAAMLAKAAPEYVKELSTMKDKAQETAEERMKQKMEEEAQKAKDATDGGAGYNFDQRMQLDRLFELNKGETETLERPQP